MSKSQKLKMSVGKFRAITIPIMSFSLVFALVLTIGTNYFTPSLDAFLGKGARTASRPTGTSGWDADYYAFESTNSEQALQRSIAVAEAIADEGIVLLKNDGTLPLTANNATTQVPAFDQDGAWYVALRPTAELLDLELTWDQPTGAIVLN